MGGRGVDGRTQNEGSLDRLKRDVLWIGREKVHDMKNFIDWTVH